jgi:predicted amidohydrolase
LLLVLCVTQVPVIANNRVGEEVYEKSRITFYGGSFISGQHGQVLAQVGGLADLTAC